jgi:hypothetical protein
VRHVLILLITIGAAQIPPGHATTLRHEETWWPNGRLRSSTNYADDVYQGVYRTWYVSGRPYELRHFDHGRETGLQQSWTEDGTLYLNYEVRNGRHYGLINAKPCLPADADGYSARSGR